MANDIPVPTLPVYEKPVDKVPATLPTGLQITKMPSTMNKMISKMLMPKMKAKLPKMKSKMPVRSKAKLPRGKIPKTKKGIQIA